MDRADTQAQAQAPVEDATMTYQIQHRLLHIDTQMAHLKAQVERLMADASETNSQFAVLVRHMTDPHPLQGVCERLADLTERVGSNREQLDLMANHLTALAGKEQLTELTSTITRLGRTQFKSNTLGETKEQQIERSLATLQELLSHRQQRQDQEEQRLQAQLQEMQHAARGELAAELLPALDSVDLALASGQALVARQRQEMAAWEQQQASAILPEELLPPAPGLWQKFRRKFAAPAPPASSTPQEPCRLPEAVTTTPDVLEAWLQGLTLVRDRFLALLTAEGIEAITALDTPFDPRLHVAVQAETRDDVAPNTVIRVLRQGYRQQQRVLRYAEVVVTRGQETHHE
jgi:molecular chaperone GrpE (heat shock protein)